jgi:hypothetical protein
MRDRHSLHQEATKREKRLLSACAFFTGYESTVEWNPLKIVLEREREEDKTLDG